MPPTEMVTSNSQQSERRSALLVATAASFLTPLMGSAVNIALPTIGIRFSLDAIWLSWVAKAYLLAAAVLCGVGIFASLARGRVRPPQP